MTTTSDVTSPGRNWSGNHAYGAARLHHPRTTAELREVVLGSERLRVLGSRHSFTDLADSPGDLVTLEAMDDAIEVAADGASVSVPGGTTYAELGPYLQERGLALANLASLPGISVAGAVATGTHGSGLGNQNLAAAVQALTLMTADGEVREIDRTHPDVAAVVVHLGALGVVTRVRLAVLPTYDVRQVVFERLPWRELLADPRAVLSAAYSVSVFTSLTDLAGGGDGAADHVWLKGVPTHVGHDAALLDAPTFHGATAATAPVHPVPGGDGEDCTVQGGVPGPWLDRLPHFRRDRRPSHGEELQSEWFVPVERAGEAIETLLGHRGLMAPLVLVCELRTMAADDLWLSPTSGRDSLALHVTWRREPEAVDAVVREIEPSLRALDARPHWGKVFGYDAAQLAAAYPRLGDFAALVDRYDPSGTFANAWLGRALGR